MNDLPTVWSGSNAVSVSQRAQRIRDLIGVARTSFIEIGRELIVARAELAHGDWLPWLSTEFGWSEDTAERYVRVARAFQIPQAAEFESIEITREALYALAAPDVPQEVRDDAIQRAKDGEHISKTAAQRMISDATAPSPISSLQTCAPAWWLNAIG